MNTEAYSIVTCVVSKMGLPLGTWRNLLFPISQQDPSGPSPNQWLSNQKWKARIPPERENTPQELQLKCLVFISSLYFSVSNMLHCIYVHVKSYCPILVSEYLYGTILPTLCMCVCVFAQHRNAQMSCIWSQIWMVDYSLSTILYSVSEQHTC